MELQSMILYIIIGVLIINLIVNVLILKKTKQSNEGFDDLSKSLVGTWLNVDNGNYCIINGDGSMIINYGDIGDQLFYESREMIYLPDSFQTQQPDRPVFSGNLDYTNSNELNIYSDHFGDGIFSKQSDCRHCSYMCQRLPDKTLGQKCQKNACSSLCS